MERLVRGGRGGGGGRGRGGGGGGGGRGRGGGRGGSRPGGGNRFLSNPEKHDLVLSRPDEIVSKKGSSGTPVNLLGNFFQLKKSASWHINHYRIVFRPEEERTFVKKDLMRKCQKSIGDYIFDGTSLYTVSRLEQPMVRTAQREGDPTIYQIEIIFVCEIPPSDIINLHFFSVVIRKCFQLLNFEEMNRNFFDSSQAINMEGRGFQLWPGFKTSMRRYEDSIMLNVNIAHKVIRTDNCLSVIKSIGSNNRDQIKKELIGLTVVTHYNRKTYKIDDIDFDTTPESTFTLKDEKISFIAYFQRKYNIRIQEKNQPMLVSLPKKKDIHRGEKQPILLCPETCQMTGFTQEMREDQSLMRDFAAHTNVIPVARITQISRLIKKFQDVPDVKKELEKWNMEFTGDLVKIKGRNLPAESIYFFNSEKYALQPGRPDWTNVSKDKKMFSVVALNIWTIIITNRDAAGLDNFVRQLKSVASKIGFPVAAPDIVKLNDIRTSTYSQAIDEVMAKARPRGRLQMLFVFLPNKKVELYSVVKKKCCLNFGILSQCFQTKNLNNQRGLMSIITKLVVQMNAKLGGGPWTILNPIKGTMFVGFDVYHSASRTGKSVGALVGTMNVELTKYYSCTAVHDKNREEISNFLQEEIKRMLVKYRESNGSFPSRIILYRDGVGEGQLAYIHGTELEQIKGAVKEIYDGSPGLEQPHLVVIVVTKRINTRFFQVNQRDAQNPLPGTIIDDVATFPERYDFYLVAQEARQGTVSPTSYNVIYNSVASKRLSPDQLHIITYKMCHMYFNWSGTVQVPAPCQYAHKLAYLTGISLMAPAREELSNFLYFL